MKNIGLVFLLMPVTFTYSQMLYPTKLTDVEIYDYHLRDGLRRYYIKNGKSGYKNNKGKISITAQYEETNDFENGYTIVGKNNKFFILKKDGTTAPLSFDYAIGFEQGLALVRKNGKSGFINTSGSIVIPPLYDDAQTFSGTYGLVKKEGKWAIIDRAGNLMTGFNFDRINQGHHDIFTTVDNGSYFFITPSGKPLFENQQFTYAGTFINGSCVVTTSEGKTFVINIKGEQLFELSYQNIAHPVPKYYIVSNREDKNGVLDIKGNLIIPLEYESFTVDENENLLLKKKSIWYILK